MTTEPIRLDARGGYFCTLLPLGFVYVAIALCHRAPSWNHWLGVTLSGPALFLLAGQFVLVPFSDWRRALICNGLLYGAPFFAALHFEWIGWITGAHFSLTAHHLTHLTKNDAIMLTVAIVIVVVIGSLCIRETRRSGILRPYLLAFGSLAALIFLGTLVLGANHWVHIHHYFWALCLVPFVRFPHPVCTITQAFLLGVYVEGAARWGMSPIWESR